MRNRIKEPFNKTCLHCSEGTSINVVKERSVLQVSGLQTTVVTIHPFKNIHSEKRVCNTSSVCTIPRAFAIAFYWLSIRNLQTRGKWTMEAVEYYSQHFRSIIHLSLLVEAMLLELSIAINCISMHDLYAHEYSMKLSNISHDQKEVQGKKSCVTSWKKLLSGYKLLRAILREVGATGSLRMSVDAMLRAAKIS